MEENKKQKQNKKSTQKRSYIVIGGFFTVTKSMYFTKKAV